jgi:hypothetical protein
MTVSSFVSAACSARRCRSQTLSSGIAEPWRSAKAWVERWSSFAIRVGPPPRDKPLVPAHQRFRSHKLASAHAGGQQPNQRREKGPVRPVEPRPRIRTAKYRYLVPKDEDLGVQRGPRPRRQRKPCQDTSEGQIEQSRRHNPRSSPIQNPTSTQVTPTVEVLRASTGGVYREKQEELALAA